MRECRRNPSAERDSVPNEPIARAADLLVNLLMTNLVNSWTYEVGCRPYPKTNALRPLGIRGIRCPLLFYTLETNRIKLEPIRFRLPWPQSNGNSYKGENSKG